MKCDFCFRQCEIPPSGRGWCAVRVNRGGAIRSLQGHRLAALAIDPVEKKPLHHFLPGSLTLSLAQCGCSFDCDFCQNADIAKALVAGEEASPPSIVTLALEKDLPSISFTYTEPLVWQDYMIPVAEAAHEAGLRTVMVTNGAFSPASLERLLPLIDAYNIDLKGDEDFYRNVCHASMAPVLDAIGRIAAHGAHLEVTTMLIEGIHDDAMVRRLSGLLEEAGVKVWHLTRFFPRRRMARCQATGEECLDRLYAVASEGNIPHIYKGNTMYPVPMRCPSCGKVLERMAFDGRCPECGASIYGLWS